MIFGIQRNKRNLITFTFKRNLLDEFNEDYYRPIKTW